MSEHADEFDALVEAAYTEPSAGGVSPVMARINVDLPEPLDPTIPIDSLA